MADFENVVVDITAEELEERVKKPIDMEARTGSLNLIYSGAVHSAVENVKVRTDNIVDGAVTGEKIADKAVTTEKIDNSSIVNRHLGGEIISEENIMSGAVTTSKIGEGAVNTNNINQYAVTRDKIQGQAIDESKILDGAVTGAKIADSTIDYNHIKAQAVTPNALDREYLRLDSSLSIVNDSSLLTLLKSNVSESGEHFKKIFMFVTRQTSEGQLTSVIGAGRCFGFYVSGSEFWFTNLKTNKVYSAVFNENELVSVSPLTEQKDFVYAGFFNRTSDLIKYNFEKRKTYSLYFVRGTGEELETNYYFAEIVYNLTSDEDELLLVPLKPNGKTFFVSFSTGECVMDFTADQTYKPTSKKAQSGVAVAEAISSALGDVETLLSSI